MLYEHLRGRWSYSIIPTREVSDGLTKRVVKGIRADFEYENGVGGRIAFDSEKLADEVLNYRIARGDVDPLNDEQMAEERVKVLKLIDNHIQATKDYKNGKIVPYRTKDEIRRKIGIFNCVYCEKSFSAEDSDNPELDLRNHIQLTQDGKHPKLDKIDKGKK